ncbi:hypothetical protein CF326_g8824 [Tilletia indica]|nr:hypothetical protein CF326_g8824 [Tilletia indica]
MDADEEREGMMSSFDKEAGTIAGDGVTVGAGAAMAEGEVDTEVVEDALECKGSGGEVAEGSPESEDERGDGNGKEAGKEDEDAGTVLEAVRLDGGEECT